MAAGTWYLKRKGKFYGPFTPDKIKGFADTGKVTNDTLVADNAEGEAAKPLAELPELKAGRDISPWTHKKAPAPKAAPKPTSEPPKREPATAKAPKPPDKRPPAKPKKPPRPEEPAVWMIHDREKDFGPYPLSHIQALVDSNKLADSDEVVHKETKERMTVEALLAGVGEVLVEHVHKKSAGEQLKRNWLWLAPVALVLVALVLLIPTAGDAAKEPDNLIGQVKKELRENNLRAKAETRDPPPYNAIVLDVMPNALMLDYRQIVNAYKSRQDFEQLHMVDGAKNFDHYKNRTRRELCYRGGEHNYIYTYQVDDDGYIFAVYVQGLDFYSYKLRSQDVNKFSEQALVLDAKDHTTWKHKIASGIYAEVLWAKKKTVWEKDGNTLKQTVGPAEEKVLQYIAVTSDLEDESHGG